MQSASPQQKAAQAAAKARKRVRKNSEAEDNYFCDAAEGKPEPQTSLRAQSMVAAAVLCTAKLAGDQLFENPESAAHPFNPQFDFWHEIEGSNNWPLKGLFVLAVFSSLVLFEFSLATIVSTLPENLFTPKPHGFAELVILTSYDVAVSVLYAPLWFHEPPPNLFGGIGPDTVYGYSSTIQILTLITCGMEMWNTWHECSFSQAGINPQFILHHGLGAILAWFVSAPFLQWYGAFFAGVAFIPSIFSNSYYFWRYYPSLMDDFPTMHMVHQATFVTTFIAFRGVYWFAVSIPWWGFMLQTLRDGGFDQISGFYPALFLVANFLISGLQVIWCSKLIMLGLEMLRGQHSKSKEA